MSLVNVNTTVLVPTEESAAGRITLLKLMSKEFTHLFGGFMAKFISWVLLWSM